MSSLIQSDYEYQREIRRKEMTDKAKIALLVGMNVQQFQTNQLLAENLRVACRTNQLLGQISGTLDQIASMQATHFEQVQRERQLKEVIYQFDKFLCETEQYGDPVAAAYGVKRLLEIIDRPGNGFTTADLSDLNDKRQLDALLTRAKATLRNLPKEQYDELDEFEKLLGVYQQRLAMGFDAEEAFPQKPHVSLSEDLRTFSQPSGTPPVCGTMKKAKSADCASYGFLVLGSFMTLMSVVGVPMAAADMAAGRRMVVESGESYPAIVPLIIYSVFGLIGVPLFASFFFTRSTRKALREEAEKEQELANSRFESEKQVEQRQWEARKREEEAKVATANQKIDAFNAQVEENRKKAKRVFDATMTDMRSLINGFLTSHPAILQFVSHV
ncbi:MAG: hypothetical protein LLF97_05835 [Planctomycetaceae bacterium]|nr:hypothetical protein [Planctomycetaceae bacterium]